MKKTIIIELLVIIISCIFTEVSAFEKIDVPDNILTYWLSVDEFKEMLDIEDDIDTFLNNKKKEEYIFEYNNLNSFIHIQKMNYDEFGNLILKTVQKVEPNSECQLMEHVSYNISELPFCRDSIQDMLAKNSINEKLEKYYIICTYPNYGYYYRFPRTMIWVKTENQVLILGLVFGDESNAEYHENLDYMPSLYMGLSYYDVPYGFKAYTFDEIRENFLPKEFDLSVNGEIQKRDKNILLIEDRGCLPILDITSQLGIETKYNKVSGELNLRYPNGNEKVMYLGIEKRYTPSELDVYDYVSLNGYDFISDGNLYITIHDCDKILKDIGYYTDVDIDNRLVNIKKIITVYLNNKQIEFDTVPITENNRILVPIRAIFEALGAEVNWNDETNTATATKDGVTVSVTIDSDIMFKNNEQVKLDASARLINDSRTFVPLRAVSEAFGCIVEWTEELQRVDILTVK